MERSKVNTTKQNAQYNKFNTKKKRINIKKNKNTNIKNNKNQCLQNFEYMKEYYYRILESILFVRCEFFRHLH